MSNCDGVWIKMYHFNEEAVNIEKIKMEIADMWLISFDHVTFNDVHMFSSPVTRGAVFIAH